MIAEFAIIPDVFDPTSYSSDEIGEICLTQLTQFCLEEAIVRDLCDGAWSGHFKMNSCPWHTATKEILETLAKHNRLGRYAQVLPVLPEDHAQWYYEASAAAKKSYVDLIIAGNPKALGCEDDASVTPLIKMFKSSWWKKRSPSVLLLRKTAEYLKTLNPILSRANLFMFIDPHIDEERANYGEFCQILRAIKRTPTHSPRIEIHIWKKGNETRSEWESRVKNSHLVMRNAKLKAEVYVWPQKFHDRYLITDLVGVSLPNGFDIDTDGVQETCWTRMGYKDRERIEKDFEPNVGHYGAVQRFEIGHNAR